MVNGLLYKPGAGVRDPTITCLFKLKAFYTWVTHMPVRVFHEKLIWGLWPQDLYLEFIFEVVALAFWKFLFLSPGRKEEVELFGSSRLICLLLSQSR
jgi:hypothetical protein